MGERKVLNKYIPSDFDPSISIRTKKKKDGAVPVRMMLPFSVQCSTCNTFLYRGTKFNSKKEPMSGPNGRYLGIQRCVSSTHTHTHTHTNIIIILFQIVKTTHPDDTCIFFFYIGTDFILSVHFVRGRCHS